MCKFLQSYEIAEIAPGICSTACGETREAQYGKNIFFDSKSNNRGTYVKVTALVLSEHTSSLQPNDIWKLICISPELACSSCIYLQNILLTVNIKSKTGTTKVLLAYSSSLHLVA